MSESNASMNQLVTAVTNAVSEVQDAQADLVAATRQLYEADQKITQTAATATTALNTANQVKNTAATQSANGLMTAADKKKLDGIAANATATAAPPAAATAAPKANGTASVGTSAKYAREDHVHPSNDTNSVTHLRVGASNGSADAATTNGNTCLMILDDNTVRDRKIIKGTGSVTVTSDANGNITINGTDTNTTYSDATTSVHGLMTAADKVKLNGITAGAQPNPGAATASAAGLMSAADKSKLDGIAAGAQVNPGAATQSANGLMTAADKKKLDGIAANATATAAPPAAATVAPKANGTASVGTSAKYAREDHVHPSNDTDTHWTTGFYVGPNNTAANGVTANGATYLKIFDNTTVRGNKLIKGTGAVTVTSDANGNLTINGTDTNTTYSVATASAAGLMSAADKSKLDGITAGANVGLPTTGGTVSGNLTVTGAGTFSNNLTVTGRFTAKEYVMATSGVITPGDIKVGGKIIPTDPTSADGSTKIEELTVDGMVHADSLYAVNTSPFLCLRISGLAMSNTNGPSATKTGIIRFQDQNKVGVASLSYQANTAKNTSLTLSVSQYETNSPKTAKLILGVTAAGTPTITASTSITTSTGVSTVSEPIATASLVSNSIDAVTGKSAAASFASTLSLAEEDTSEISPTVLADTLYVLKEDVRNHVFYGFSYEIDKETYYFTYDLYDQQNFADLANLASRYEQISVIARRETGEMVKLLMAANDFLALYDYAVYDHKQSIMFENLERIAKIRAAKTDGEILALLKEWDLLVEYQAKVDARELIESVSENEAA